jgi:hypothetical protein
MHQPRTRRSLLTAVAALAASRLLLGPEQSARATEKPYRVPDYDSRFDFRIACTTSGGTFHLTGLDETTCTWPDGSVTTCNGSGRTCLHTPAPGPVPLDLADNSLKGDPSPEDEPDAEPSPDDVDVPGAPDPIAAPRTLNARRRKRRRRH